MMEYIIFLLTLCLIFIFYWLTRNSKYFQRRGVTVIHPILPFFGNFLKLIFSRTNPGILIKKFYEQSENQPYVGFYSFMKPCLLLRDPELIKKVFITDFENFSDKFTRSARKNKLSNESLPFLKNPEWTSWRTKLTPAFSPGKIRSSFGDLQLVTKEADQYLDKLQLDGLGKEIDVKEFLSKFTTDIVGLSAFGIQLKSFHPGALFRKFGKQMFGEYGCRRRYELSCVYLAPHVTDLLDFRFFEKVSGEFFKQNFKKILGDREKSKLKRGDFADLLLQIKKNDDSISFDQIISQALIFFTAGFDTTSAVMTFILKELASNLNIQSKLRFEIMCAIKGEEISYEMIKDLPYLEMVVLETLRLHPTVPTIDRIAKNDYTIDETGLVIEKGTPVYISLLGLHYDPKYFPDPEVFDPERFSEENNGSKNPAYMPFGIGPRKCIAYHQGLMHVKYIIAHLISKYEVTLASSPEEEISKVYFTAGGGGVYLNMRKL